MLLSILISLMGLGDVFFIISIQPEGGVHDGFSSYHNSHKPSFRINCKIGSVGLFWQSLESAIPPQR